MNSTSPPPPPSAAPAARDSVGMSAGGVALAAIAGWCNSVGLLGVYHQAITHVTGTATQGAAAIARGEGVAAVTALSIVFAFGVGSVLAGAIVHRTDVMLDVVVARRYSVALLLEGALLVLAWRLLSDGVVVGEHAAAVAAGLQNALAARVSGAVVRTTHITGLVTDVGLAVGGRISSLFRHGVAAATAHTESRTTLQVMLIAGFVVGAVAGAFAFGLVGTHALLGPAAACAVLAALSWRR